MCGEDHDRFWCTIVWCAIAFIVCLLQIEASFDTKFVIFPANIDNKDNIVEYEQDNRYHCPPYHSNHQHQFDGLVHFEKTDCCAGIDR